MTTFVGAAMTADTVGAGAFRTSPSSATGQARERLAESSVLVDSARRVIGIGGAIAAMWWVGGPWLALGQVVCVVGLQRLRPLLTERRRAISVNEALPEAFDLLVVLLHSGLTLRQAMAELATKSPSPTRPGFARVNRQLSAGRPFSEAVGSLHDDLGPGAAGVIDVIATSGHRGLPLVSVIQQLSAEARRARSQRATAAARRLPIHLSFPLVVCTLPSFVLLTIAPAVMAALSSLRSDAW